MLETFANLILNINLDIHYNPKNNIIALLTIILNVITSLLFLWFFY